MEFKIGDKIKVKDKGPFHNLDAKYVKGMIGTVIEVDRQEDYSIHAYFEQDIFEGTHSWWVCIDDLDLPQNIEKTLLPSEADRRKGIPIVSGVLDYFPAAIAEVAKISKAGNDQHNPGEPLHWSRGKSADHADCVARHLLERGTVDTDGQRHSAKLAWRALAILQLELEAEGAPIARGATNES